MKRTSAGYLYMDKQNFTKQPLSIDQQLDLLRQRNLTISDESFARLCLETVSFHRLSAYSLPFERDKKSHLFQKDITFSHIWNLYLFDRKLRLLVLDIIERFEIALRTTLSNHLAVKHGAWWYLEDGVFKTSWIKKNHKDYSPKDIFLYELNSVCSDKKHNEAIKHYYQKYDKPPYPPSWIVLEFLSFGKCTSLYRYLRSPKDKAGISAIFGVHQNIFESSLEPLRYTRNLCAHHSRLWDRWFVYKPRTLRELKAADCLPGTLKEQLALLHLLTTKISPQSNWKQRLHDLFAQYEQFVQFKLMGFTKNWRDDPFWQV